MEYVKHNTFSPYGNRLHFDYFCFVGVSDCGYLPHTVVPKSTTMESGVGCIISTEKSDLIGR